MKAVENTFALLATRALGAWVMISIHLFIGGALALGQQPNKVSEPDFTYKGTGKKVTTTSTEKSMYGDVTTVTVEIFDSDGVRREFYDTQTDVKTSRITYRADAFYDCHGVITSEKTVRYSSITGDEISFNEKRYKDGNLIYGYEWEIDEKGKKVTKKFNAKTRKYEEAALATTPSDEVGAPERDTNFCSKPFYPNEVVGFFSFIREDSSPRFNTYGGGASYTRFINSSIGLTADFNANFRTQNAVDLSKISVLGGVTVLPFDGAKTTDKVTFSTHSLFGASHFKSDAGAISFTDNAFTMKLGGVVDVNVTDNFFIRPVQIDYAPTFFGDNTQHNVQFGFGAGFRFGRK